LSFSYDSFFLNGIDSRDFDLPHPRFPEPMLLVIHNAITRAFEILRAKDADELMGMLEDDITFALWVVLENDLRRNGSVPGFNSDLFERVIGQHEVSTHSGSSIQKRPDMQFALQEERPRTLASEDVLSVECKPVGKSHSIKAHYGEKGIRRFVEGEYASAMQDALMIAYVRDQFSIEGNLDPYLRTPEAAYLNALECPGERSGSQSFHRTTHERKFPWRDGKGPACPIRIFHSWQPL